MDAGLLNRMLEGHVKDCASMKRGTSKEDLETRKIHLLKALGLHPLPPRTDLAARITGTLQRDGYRIEKLRFESRIGLLVTAHAYVPDGQGPWPLLVSAHGPWPGKKAAPVVQARGIAFALRGFLTLVVDSPGSFGDDPALDERGTIGGPGEPSLLMGAPWIGQYVWDLIRGAESCLGRTDVDASKVAITGDGDGGIAALCAFVSEPRFSLAALVCTAPSLEQGSLETIAKLGIPGLSLAGDFSDILAIRAPAPVALFSAAEDARYNDADVRRTGEKLSRLSKLVRCEAFECGHDYNRRMREAVAAFLAEHMQGIPHRSHLPEPRPLTDGAENPYPSGTVPVDDPALAVTSNRQTITFQDVLRHNLSEPYPEPFHPGDRLVPWLRFGALQKQPAGTHVALYDNPGGKPASSDAIGLPYELVDMRLAAMSGISVPEFFAQILHLSLPGRPETWESQAVAGGEGLSAMIASVKTLIQSAAPETVPTDLTADGPVSSLTAMFLRLYRPALQIATSHRWTGWQDLLQTPVVQLIQPQARYLDWPF